MTVKIAGREVDAIIFDLEKTLYSAEEADRIFAPARKQLAIALLSSTNALTEPRGDVVDGRTKELIALADQIGWSKAYSQMGGNIEFYHRVVRGIDRSEGLQFNPQLNQMLIDLRGQVKIGLLTKATVSTAEAICAKILGNKWQSLFHAVVCDGTPGCPAEKPDPRAFEFTLGQLGVTAERTAMVGDSLADDILPTAAFGLVTVKVGGEKVGPWNLHINRIEELVDRLTTPQQTVNLRK